MSVIIECENISKIYKLRAGDNNALSESVVNALHEVSFTLNEGDRLGLIGLNGSGKSTLLKILGGFIKPSNGRVLLHKKVTSLSSFDSILHPDLNAFENCRLQLQVLGFNKADIPGAIEQIIEFSELRNFMYQPVKTFSSGMMLRLSLSIFSIIKPEILLLDEVFSAGDIKFQKKIEELMQSTFKNTSGIIIASHQLNEIEQYCNKCLVLKNGTVEFYGKVNDAMKKYYDINIKPEIKYYSDLLTVENLSINKTLFKTSDPIIITFKVKLSEINIELFPSLYITNHSGKILTDSPVYESNFILNKTDQLEYEYQVEIPKNLLNIGTFNVSIYLGNTKEELYVTMLNQFIITVVSEEWEENVPWGIPTDFPIRTRLNWNINI